ncbi:calcium-binding protein [Nonomuraea sp. B12E4]|uniref:calcium-binding protein n=1 Tax=Nonomuraea sp. B12E4 TaxID=3153564 RepID=UPI00325DF8D1
MKVRKAALWLGAAVLAAGLTAVPSGSAMADVDPLDPNTGDVWLDSAGVLFFHGGYGDNHVRIIPDSYGRVRVIDDNYPIFPGGGCTDVTDNEVQCDAGATGLYVDGHGGSDTIVNLLPTKDKLDARLFGGWGNDVVYGGPGVQWVSGGLSPEDLRANRGQPEKGNDQLFGGCEQQCADGGDLMEGSDGNDALDGGPGDDELRGGLGTDTYKGGTGDHDMVSYGEHGESVKASLNGLADDGAAGELENIPGDVEDLYGGWQSDTLIGNEADNTLNGGPGGGDMLIGMQGVDWLYGGSGYDKLYGDFNDSRQMGEGDYLYGGAGNDLLVGEWGLDHAREYDYDEGADTCVSTEFVDYDACESTLSWP